LAALDGFRADGLIQTTPVGMAPEMQKSPLKRESLANFRYVMDAFTTPDDEAPPGCGGDGLHSHQRAWAFLSTRGRADRIWTGLEPPVARMRQAVLDTLMKE